MEMPKLFEKFTAIFRTEGRNQKQSIKNSENIVASQTRGAPATSVLQAQVIVERHGYARTPTDLFSDFDHAISNYHKHGETEATDPPALLVTDWDIMIIQMLFRENSSLKDKVNIVDGAISYKSIPLKHPTAGVLRMTPDAVPPAE